MNGWYPQDKGSLVGLIKDSLSSKNIPNVRSIIVPHAGYRFCSRTLGKVFGNINCGDFYDKAIVIGPSHTKRLDSFATVPSFNCYQTPLGECNNDYDTISNLSGSDCFEVDDSVHLQDHSIQSLIPYIQYCLPNSTIVPIIIGSHPLDMIEKISNEIKLNITQKTLLIISSDFTHYGERFNYTPFGMLNEECLKKIKSFDMQAINYVLDLDLNKYLNFISNHKNTICGRQAILIMLKILQGSGLSSSLCDYSNSCEVIKSSKNCVSYSGLCYYDN